jgi:hypothetical protein
MQSAFTKYVETMNMRPEMVLGLNIAIINSMPFHPKDGKIVHKLRIQTVRNTIRKIGESCQMIGRITGNGRLSEPTRLVTR